MIDIKFLREHPDIVKENIKKKFQDHKLPLVDEVLELDKKNKEITIKDDDLRNKRNSLSSQIGLLMREGKKEEAESIKSQVKEINSLLTLTQLLEQMLLLIIYSGFKELKELRPGNSILIVWLYY